MNSEFKSICDLFGGQTATSRILELKDSRYIRRIIQGKNKLPEGWLSKLRSEAKERSEALKLFSESGVLWK